MATTIAKPPSQLSVGRRRLILGICCLSLLIVGLDSTVVNVALPAIQRSLHASVSDLQWTIAFGENRAEAIDRMQSCLDEMIVEGIKTTIPFHRALMRNDRFRAGDFDTHFLETFDWKSGG